jgi:2-dehydropantoate 2-reductase
MRCVILGAGAMGSLFAAHLARTDAETWVCDPWAEHIDAIRRGGLRVTREGVETSLPLQATTDPGEPGAADVLMLWVKYHQTARALESAAPLVGPSTVIVTLQNGLGNVELVRERFPASRVLYGLTTLTSELLGPGRIEASYAGRGETSFWSLDGRRDAQMEAVRDLLERAGIHAIIAPDIEVTIWKKLVVNCGLNTLCAITGLTVGGLAERPEAWALLDGIADEIVALAEARGIPLGRAAAHEYLRWVAHEARAHEPSMLIDVRHRRPTEIECLNGAILRECDRRGIAAPYNRAVYSLIKVLEAGK